MGMGSRSRPIPYFGEPETASDAQLGLSGLRISTGLRITF